MPNYFITFRAHSGEPQVFEDWMILLMTIVKKHGKKKSFAYQVEWDETPSRHIHLLLYDIEHLTKLDAQTEFGAMFNNKKEKLFKKYLENKLTSWMKDEDNKGFCTIIRCDDNDPLKSTDYYLGYIHKHNCSRRGHSSDITSELIHDAVMLYYTTKKLSKREEKNNDIKLITSKNIYSHLISFVDNDQNETSFADKSLKVKTVYKGHFGYANISDNAESKAFTELRIMNNCEEKNDIKNCNNSAKNKKDIEMESFVCPVCEIQETSYADLSGYSRATDYYHDLINLINVYEDPEQDVEFTIKCIKKKYSFLRKEINGRMTLYDSKMELNKFIKDKKK